MPAINKNQPALSTWRESIQQARQAAKNRRWRDGLFHYSHALDDAESLFIQQPVSLAVKRYIRTASELAYTIKQSGYKHTPEILSHRVVNTVNKTLFPANTQLLIRPLLAIIEAPAHQVHWQMRKLFND